MHRVRRFGKSLVRLMLVFASWMAGALAVFMGAYYVGWKSAPVPPAARPAVIERTAAPDADTSASAPPASSAADSAADEPARLATLVRQLASRRDRRFAQTQTVADIAGMDLDEVGRALADLERAPATDLQQELRLYLLQRWASLEPRAAWDYLRARAAHPREVSSLGAAESVLLHRWARAEPEGALQAWRELNAEEQQRYRFVLGQIFAIVAAREPERAIALAEAMPGEHQTAAWAGLASAARSDTHREPVLAKLGALPAGELRSRALGAALNAWAESGRAAEAVAWLDQASLELDERTQIEAQMAIPFFHLDRHAAADWLLSRAASPASRAERLEQIAALWARDDPSACGQWLIAQGLGAEASRAMLIYADTIAANSPAAALTWARSIPDKTTRQKALAQVERKLRERHPHRVHELLNASQ